MMTKMDANVLNAFDGGPTDVAGFEKEMSGQMTAMSQKDMIVKTAIILVPMSVQQPINLFLTLLLVFRNSVTKM